MNPAKSFPITKHQVWEAYKRVKANHGGAGIDAQTLEKFDQDLSNNLYKLWNRMASGSYLPPPVKRVDIPKANGGTRSLGIPTVADRIAQTVVVLSISTESDMASFKLQTCLVGGSEVQALSWTPTARRELVAECSPKST